MKASDKKQIIKYIEKNQGVLKGRVIEEFSYLGVSLVESFIHNSKEIIKKEHKEGTKLYIKKRGCLGCLAILAIIFVIGSCVATGNDEEKEVVTPITEEKDEKEKAEEDNRKAEEQAAKEKQEQAKKEQEEQERREKQEEDKREREALAKKEQEERERLEQETKKEEEKEAASVNYSIDKDCSDFSREGEATQFMNASVAAGYGDHRLDRDGDGKACDD
ncbi:excalibur calcium-binding domain-containing protein [Fictibacillus sp. JL2B1089]|uniref:excalibur calcium-binding domain-containing protein n=1 Tax=Fictibacillus sp. JL2B1089 TaxID=3399565 RepID=UPI003A8692E3